MGDLFLSQQGDYMPVRIEKWCVRNRSDGTKALVGDVYGHPHHLDGTFVTTSDLDGRIGETVVTRSGTVYTLGDYCMKASTASQKAALLETLDDAAA